MDSVISWAILTALGLFVLARLMIRRCAYLGQAHTGFNPCPGANSIYCGDWQKFATGGR